MTLSQDYLASVSMMIVYGQESKATAFNYYYYQPFAYNTYPPTGVVAVLKSQGNIVATLRGVVTRVTASEANMLFYDTSTNSYSFDEVDIYTERNGSLAILVSRNTGLSYTKSSDEVVVVYFSLTIEQTTSVFVNYAFFYLLVPYISKCEVFPIRVYEGILNYEVSGVQSGSVQFMGAGFAPNQLLIFLLLTTTGGGTPTITALTNPFSPTAGIRGPTIGISLQNTREVFSATLNVSLPSTSTQMQYPIVIGLTYEVT